MALEAVVFQEDPFSYGYGGWSYDCLPEGEKACHEIVDGNHWESSSSSMVLQNTVKEWDTNSSSPEAWPTEGGSLAGSLAGKEFPATTSGRRKRRRAKIIKKKEDVENQRMTHIAVERNRRKQMNEYLAVLRSLMPASYVQRGDQASIIGGAINFVKELEQLFQTLEAQKRITKQQTDTCYSPLFSDFFTFPQYSTYSAAAADTTAENRSAADVEVTMVESHANLRVLTKRRPKQLLKLVAGINSLRLTILHLNVTTVDQMVLYSFSVKVEDDCQLSSVNEIATAVYEMVGRIQEEAATFS